ncbi:hypothetical protein ACFSR9_06940 [Deinococcus taklimakanensis]|uniref:Uncharacterized protein n=1 Tax=Deinococcus taklimakanensis TaxID=536443 RepID=A0ABW5P217_9DEIO
MSPQKARRTRKKCRSKPGSRVPEPPTLTVPTTWEGITQEFSGIKLERLLLLSALLSADDALGGGHWSELNTFRHLHPALLQNFTRAIIASEAQYDTLATPSTAHFLFTLINGVGELQNPPNMEDIPTMDGPTLVTDVFSLMWRHQARLDGRSVFMADVGRAHATLVHFPDQLATQIRAKQKTGYVHLDTHFKKTYGCSIDTVLQGLMLIFFRYATIFNSNGILNPSWLQQLRPDGGQMKVDEYSLRKYVDGALPQLPQLKIPEEELIAYLGRWLPPEEVPHFLALVSGTIDDLRVMLKRSPFSSGVEAFARLPLEVKPLLKLPDGQYVIPNLRSMQAGLARLPLTLLASDSNPNVMTCYGQGLEGYVVAATEDRLAGSGTTVIPEFRYKRSGTKNSIESADATLIEPGNRPTLIEVKAIRLPDYGLALPGSAAFKGIDDLITKTVLSGLNKAEDLTTSWPSPHSATLAAASTEPALVVVVYGESVPNFDGVFRTRINANHPLHPHLGRFVPLSIAEYEHHLDIARERGLSVIDLLQQSADEFKERDLLQMTSYVHLGNTWPKDPFVDRFTTDLLAGLSTDAVSDAPSDPSSPSTSGEAE